MIAVSHSGRANTGDGIRHGLGGLNSVDWTTVGGSALTGALLGPASAAVTAVTPAGRVPGSGWWHGEDATIGRMLCMTSLNATTLAALGGRFGGHTDLPAWYLFAITAGVLAVIDAEHHLLPRYIITPAIFGGGALLLAASFFDHALSMFLRAAFASITVFTVSLLIAALTNQLGFGDVRLAAFLGLYLGWLGWDRLVAGFFVGFIVSALTGVALLLSHRITRRERFALGPPLIAGTLATVLALGHS